MNVMERLSPSFFSPQIVAKGGLQVARERILQSNLVGIAPAAIIAAVVVVILNRGLPADPQQLIWMMMFVWLAVVVFWRELPYSLRAATLVALPYMLAISELINTGVLGYILFWLAIFAILTSIFFGFRVAMAAIALNVATTVSVGLLLQYHWLQLPGTNNFFLGFGWGINTMIVNMVSFGVISATSGIIRGMELILAERENLSRELEKSRGVLEVQVQERTIDIGRRLAQMRTAAEISNAISQLNDPDTLYQRVVELVQERFGLYYVGIFLVDDNNRYAVLIAGSGIAGRAMLANHHRLQIGTSSMIGWCVSNRRSRIALDVGKDAVRFNNPNLPQTRSELALPILSRGVALGALTVQSEQPAAFDTDDILVLQGIADGLAAAIENVHLVSELKQNLDELRGVNRTYLHQAWSEVITDRGSLSYAYQTVQTITPNTYTIEYPILLRGQIIAKLNLETDHAELTQEEEALLDALTTQTALALENARLVEKTERRADQEQTLNSLSERFSNALDIDSILRTAIEALGHFPSVTEVSVELVAPDQVAQNGSDQEETE
jgi:GAF domain-containing protein